MRVGSPSPAGCSIIDEGSTSECGSSVLGLSRSALRAGSEKSSAATTAVQRKRSSESSEQLPGECARPCGRGGTCACAHRWCRTLQRVQLAVALLVCGLVVQATCAGQKERSEQHVARHESGAVDEGLDDVGTPHVGAQSGGDNQRTSSTRLQNAGSTLAIPSSYGVRHAMLTGHSLTPA